MLVRAHSSNSIYLRDFLSHFPNLRLDFRQKNNLTQRFFLFKPGNMSSTESQQLRAHQVSNSDKQKNCGLYFNKNCCQSLLEAYQLKYAPLWAESTDLNLRSSRDVSGQSWYFIYQCTLLLSTESILASLCTDKTCKFIITFIVVFQLSDGVNVALP